MDVIRFVRDSQTRLFDFVVVYNGRKLRTEGKVCYARCSDKTVLSVSSPLRWCELDFRQLKIVADRKFEV